MTRNKLHNLCIFKLQFFFYSFYFNSKAYLTFLFKKYYMEIEHFENIINLFKSYYFFELESKFTHV